MTLWERAEARCAQTPRRFVDWPAFWLEETDIRPSEHRLYLSSQRSVWDDCCHRQVCAAELAPWPPTAIVGPYLKLLAESHDLAPHVDHPYLIHRTPPLYFDRAYDGEIVYVDLVRAYWSIYTRTTLDVVYDGEGLPRRGIVGWEDADRLGEDRIVRNSVIGFLRREWRRGIDHGEAFKEEVPHWRRRPDLWGLVMDCLEVVAWAMRDQGAIYVHTDGFIFPHRELADDAIDLLDSRFALSGTIRAAGVGHVRGLGRFRVGDASYGARGAVDETRPWSRIDNMLAGNQRQIECLTEWLRDSSIHVPTERSLNGSVIQHP